jgi:hypothetical protein
LPAAPWLAKRSTQCPFFLIKHYFFIKIYMKEGHSHIGRRNFLKLGAAAALAAGGYTGFKFLLDNDLIPNPIPPRKNPVSSDLAKKLDEAEATVTATPFQPATPETKTTQVTPSSEVTPEVPNDLFGGKIDFFDYEKAEPQNQKPIEGLLETRSGQKLAISPFKTTSIEEDFSAGKGLGKTWKDLRRYQGINVVDYFLFLHSGTMKFTNAPLEMTDIQEYLDKDPVTTFRRNYWVPYQILKDEFLGSPVVFKQEGNGEVLGKITAAIRIAPLEVNDLFVVIENKLVWRSDLLEYLAQKYPGFGFENVLDRNKNLVLITCGKNLNGGEAKIPDLPDYEQARYIFVITAN